MNIKKYEAGPTKICIQRGERKTDAIRWMIWLMSHIYVASCKQVSDPIWILSRYVTLEMTDVNAINASSLLLGCTCYKAVSLRSDHPRFISVLAVSESTSIRPPPANEAVPHQCFIDMCFGAT